MQYRHYSKFDEICLGFDQALRAVMGISKTTGRKTPGAHELLEDYLSPEQAKASAGFMRVNHAGEVCAQALYHGQGLATRNNYLKDKMQQAAIEEGDHLHWCQERIEELGSHTSYLNPVWYAGSFLIGFAAGMIGDKWSLGFVAETETQVIRHLEKHLKLLPSKDVKSYQILLQMQKDESEHRKEAIEAGAESLPGFIKSLMNLTSKMMVKIAYWV